MSTTSTDTITASITATATTTASATSTSKTPDPQSWVFPPPGPSQLPLTSTSNFGPINNNDTMILEWTPDTKPEIYMSCFTLSLRQTTFKVVTAGAAKTPFSYQFNFKANSTGPLDLAYCHYWFNPSNNGNSGNFQYINEAASSPVTWSSNMKATSSSRSAGGSATASSSSSSAQVPSSQQHNHDGLSSGAKAGIGIGVAFGIIAIILGIFILLRRRRQAAVQQTVYAGQHHTGEMHGEPVYDKSQTYSVYEKRLSTPPVEMDAGVVGHEMPGPPKA